MKFQNITVGGTFDHLHKGHQELLNAAFSSGEKVWLGITNDIYLQDQKLKIKNQSHSLKINNYSERKQEVEKYISSRGFADRAKIVEIQDKYGTTLKDKNLEAVVVSPETEVVAQEINRLRLQKGWPDMEIIKVPWILAEDGKPISSQRIRNGEIDRVGKVFRLPDNWVVRRLPDDLRDKFKKPLGRLVNSVSDLSYLSHLDISLIAIGDATTSNLLKAGIIPDISIVDLKIHRQPVYKNVRDLGFRDIKLLKTADNPSGTITYDAYIELISLIRQISQIGKPSVLQIEGEDDLLTLLAIFLAPLNSLIIYGQPDIGLVVVEVAEGKKQEARKYLEMFKR